MFGLEPGFPLVAFQFDVRIGHSLIQDGAFAEVSGLNATLETETVTVGADTAASYKLPKGMKYDNLLLKRGAARIGGELAAWVSATLNNGANRPVSCKDIEVRLLGDGGIPLRSWNVANAYPVRWEVSGFDSQKNQVLMETVEFSYQSFTIGSGGTIGG